MKRRRTPEVQEGRITKPGAHSQKTLVTKPPSYDIPIESIIPGGWGDEFDDDEPINEKDKKS